MHLLSSEGFLCWKKHFSSLPNTRTPVVDGPAAPEGTQFPQRLDFHLLPLLSVLAALLVAGDSHAVTTFSMD